MPKFQWTVGRVGAKQALTCQRSPQLSSTIKLTRRGFRSSILRNQVRSQTMIRFLYQLLRSPSRTKWVRILCTLDPSKLTMIPKHGKAMGNSLELGMTHPWLTLGSREGLGCSHSNQVKDGRGVKKVIQGLTLSKDAQNVTEIGQDVLKGAVIVIQIMAHSTDDQNQEVSPAVQVVKLTTGPL